MVFGMTTQITVRLPDEEVEFIDRRVAAGQVPSRAAAVAEALRQMRRRLDQEEEIRTYLAVRTPEAEAELDAIVAATAHAPLDID